MANQWEFHVGQIRHYVNPLPHGEGSFNYIITGISRIGDGNSKDYLKTVTITKATAERGAYMLLVMNLVSKQKFEWFIGIPEVNDRIVA
jgi:hypothetical protein